MKVEADGGGRAADDEGEEFSRETRAGVGVRGDCELVRGSGREVGAAARGDWRGGASSIDAIAEGSARARSRACVPRMRAPRGRTPTERKFPRVVQSAAARHLRLRVDVGPSDARRVSLHAARSRAETVVMEKITFGDAAVPGYERGEKTAPAVIVLQEWWGVTKNITAQAERIASEGGYRVLIPDLYKGKLGVNVEEAHHLMSNLDWPAAKGAIRHHAVATRALPPVVVVTSSDAPVEKGPPWTPPPPDEMCAAARYLKSTGSPKVAVIGFCMGGALALIAAQHSEDVDCCLPFYGTPDRASARRRPSRNPCRRTSARRIPLRGFPTQPPLLG